MSTALVVATLAAALLAAPPQDRPATEAPTKPPSAQDAPAHRPRSVVFYLIDTCRADHLSVDGYGRPTTPFLEELAARGVRFENCFSQAPWTKPSMSSILTSCYPTVTGMLEITDQLSGSFVTFPEVLNKHGWYTAGFSANPLMGRWSNYNQGFREFTDATQVIKNGDCIHFASGSAKALNAKVLPWIEKNERWPFLLYVHSVDPHEEYAPSPEYLKLFADPALEPDYRRQWQALLDAKATKVANHCTQPDFDKAGVAVAPFIDYGERLYDADLRANDDEIAHLVDALREKGTLDDTILIVTADHGEEFMEHGGTSHAFLLWNELIHVPLIFVAPGLLQEGLVVKEPVQSIDLYPTLLELLGLPIPDEIQGKSFAPLLRGEPGDGRPIFSENHETPVGAQYFLPQGATLAMIRGPWKYILNLKPAYNRPRPRHELYRLDTDFAERHDVAADHPDLVERFEQEILEWWARNRARHEGVDVKHLSLDELQDADPATVERLRQLGYIR